MYFKVVLCSVVVFVKIACSASVSDATERTYPLATTPGNIFEDPTTKSRYEKGLEDYDEAQENSRKSRGMMTMGDDYHDHHDEHDDHKDMSEQKAVKEDPWGEYYDFLINEGSFKFWAVFQLVTAALLIYSAFAAVYYAKFNVITTDYDYYDDFFGRSMPEPSGNSWWSGLSSQTFQRIFDAISSKKYK